MQKGFLERFAWFAITFFVVISHGMGYAIFGSAFATVPREYQWILAILSPLVKDFYNKIIVEVAYKSAGKTSRGKRSIRYPVGHNMVTKHAVFLAIVVSGVASPETTYCLMAVDFVKAMYSGYKIVVSAKNGKDVADLEGMYMYVNMIYFVWLVV